MILQLLTAGRKVRTIVASPTRATTLRASRIASDVQVARALLFEDDRDHHARSLDAVAGGEFIDDRIRIRE